MDNPSRFNNLSIALHWLMLILIVLAYGCIEFRELYERGSDPREALKAWHFTIGLTILALIWIRVGLYIFQRQPLIQPALPKWQHISSRIVHILLLAFMVVMPVTGWLILSGEGDPVPFWGLELPAIMGENKDLAHDIEEIHEELGEIGYFLIGLHAAAALFHHYIRKDNTLRRMLPWTD